jgi:hypothetical protein
MQPRLAYRYKPGKPGMGNAGYTTANGFGSTSMVGAPRDKGNRSEFRTEADNSPTGEVDEIVVTNPNAARV